MLGALGRVVSFEAGCQWALLSVMMVMAQSLPAIVAWLGALGRMVSFEAGCQWALLSVMMVMQSYSAVTPYYCSMARCAG